MLRIRWQVRDLGSRDYEGDETLQPGARLVLARRMTLPETAPVAIEHLDGSTAILVRLPYVSDPALVISSTDQHPVVFRGQRSNGAVVEVVGAGTPAVTPAPEQRLSITDSGTVVTLRVPELVFEARLEFEESPRSQPNPADGLGTMELGVGALEHDDTWLVAALAVALSPEHGVVSHGDLRSAYARWRGIPEPSDGSFDRTVLRPALAARSIELPGARLNKIWYLVERCRQTAEFPPSILVELQRRVEA